MNEISLAAPRSAASRARGIPTDERELWAALCAEARRAAAREEVLRGFLDLAVLSQPGFDSALSSLLAHKLAEPSLPAEAARRHRPHRDG